MTPALARARDILGTGWGLGRDLLGRRRVYLLEWVARAGYAARGLVYLLLGVLAFMAALELREAPAGTYQTLVAFGQWPLGPLWLLVLGFGLLGFMAWRLVQSVFDAEHKGTSPGALVHRAGQALSGLIYGGLGLTALELSDSLEALNPGHPEYAEVERVLASSLGGELLLAVGVSIAVGALGNAAKAFSSGFDRELGCQEEVRRWVVPMGRAGYLARAFVFALFATLTLNAALVASKAGIDSVGGTLQTLEGQPFGSALLVVASLGLAAFGIYGFVEARYRSITVPRELRETAG